MPGQAVQASTSHLLRPNYISHAGRSFKLMLINAQRLARAVDLLLTFASF